jgi:tripartite-type tricarboxylate transporter receptor subunit TctC
MRRRDFVGAGAAALLASPSGAQQPGRPLHVIVPSSAGGVHDVIARIWADRVRPSLGAIVVENRSGGSASIAINAVAQSPPDGTTLLLGSTSNLVLREGMGNRIYDAAKELTPASIFAATSTSITVNPAVPARSLSELIAYIRANPGKLSYCSGGVGAITHVTVELFKQVTGGLDIVHIPYKGMAPAMNDLISGEIAVGFVNITAQVLALHRGGKIRILCVNAPARLDAAPDIPTTAEQGVADFVSQAFFGLFAPLATPRAALERIDQATQARWTDPDFRKRLTDSGFEPLLGLGPDAAKAYLEREIARWTPIVQDVVGR